MPWGLLAGMLSPLFSAIGPTVPEPRPVPTDIKVGSYYFPGHFHAGRWSPMKTYGHPRPLLGYYRDGAPGVCDWHIKWAVEHGLSYFVFDWYYDYHTGTVAAHDTALDEGFLKAKYGALMQFALLWCNEEGRQDAPYTEEQILTLGKVIGQRYFRQANYLKIDGRPVLFVIDPMRLWDSFGPRFRELLPRFSRAAGLPEGTDIYLVGERSADLDKSAQMGFSACSAYNYSGTRVADTSSPLRASYDDMVDGYESMWKQVTADGHLPYIVPVSPGWDSRPWYGPRAFVRTNPTAAKFREMCDRAKRYVDPKLKMVISECWNEFGEGSFIEPTEEYGFGALDALRASFGRPGAWPPNVVPSAEEKAAWTWRAADIPDDPQHLRAEQPTGSLLPQGDMESADGWLTFSQGPAEHSTEQPHSGRRCLVINPAEQAKSASQVGLLFGRMYQVTAWVRCSPGASVQVTAALFGPNGTWMRAYHDLGAAKASEWTEVTQTVPALDPSVGAIDVEFVASGGTCWADDVSIVAGPPPSRIAPVFEDRGTQPDAWVGYDGSAVHLEEGGLVVPAGTGIKTRVSFPASPEIAYGLQATIKCDEKATLMIQAAEFDGSGTWLHSYTGPGAYSWQEWVDVSGTIGFRPDSPAKRADIEFAAVGGRAWVKNVRLVRGQTLPRR